MAVLNVSTGSAHARILGLGVYRPSRLVPNSEVVDAIDSSDEWIQQRSGIRSRHRAAPDETVVDMSEHAARAAIAHAGLEPGDIEAIFVATVTHPYQTPAAAPELASRLGLTCMALDISAACAGYCHGIGLASDLVRAGSARHVLVVGVEKLSDFIDNSERSISFLLGDGAGAVVVGPSEEAGIGPTVWGSDGSKWETINMTHSLLEVRNRDWINDPVQEDEQVWPTLYQDGPTVFRWAAWEMAKVAQQALDEAGVSAEDLGAFVPHQANMRIIDQLVKTLKLPDHVVVGRDIADAGNTSAASVPLAARRLLDEHPELSGRLALQIGFGAGLVYAAQVVVLP